MNCFPCFTSSKSKRCNSKKENGFGYGPAPQEQVITRTPDAVRKVKQDDPSQVDTSNIQAHNFTFRELATATKNFRQECFMGEGGFGRVYKGTIPATGQVVAVKQLDRNGMQGSEEFLVEVLMLSLLNHENLVKLTGYCADGDQRLLVYEFMPGGPLERRLLERGPDQPPLDWYSRMKIASNAAKGLWYLHDKANPPVIFRDLKSSNILLDNDLNAKLTDYGLAKLAGKDRMNIAPTRVMGTYGYSAPEYIRTGNLTLKSDVYSFGVVLLELITGRRAVDTTRPNEEQNLVSWAQPIFRDPKRYPDMADPLLKNQYPEKDLNQVVAIAAMCLQEESAARPLMSDVVTALSFLSTTPPAVVPAPAPAPLPPATSHKSAATESASEYESDHSESESEYSHSSDEEGSHHHHHHSKNETAKNQVSAVSAKYEDSSDVSDDEYDYYVSENQQEYSPQDVRETKAFYAKASLKSSTKSRNNSSDSEDGGVSTDRKQNSRKHLSQKSSKKSSNREGKSIKKSSLKERDLTQKKSSKKHSPKEKDLNQKKSGKKHSLKDRDLGHKSSKKKSAVKMLSRKRSAEVGSEEGSFSSRGNVSLSRNSSSGEEPHAMLEHKSYQGNVSSGLFSSISSDSHSNSNMKSHEGNNKHFDHHDSRGSDAHSGHDSTSSYDGEGSFHHYDRATSKGSHKEAVHS